MSGSQDSTMSSDEVYAVAEQDLDDDEANSSESESLEDQEDLSENSQDNSQEVGNKSDTEESDSDSESETFSDSESEDEDKCERYIVKDWEDESSVDNSQMSASQYQSEDESSINTVLRILPNPEIQKLIFSQMDTPSKLQSRLVCKQWEKLVNQIIGSSPILYDDSAEMLMKMAEKGIPIQNLTISKLKKFKYPEKGIGFVSVNCIKFIPYRRSRISSKIQGISDENLRHTLEEFQDISSLYLHSGSFEDVLCPSILATTSLPNLKHIEISAYNGDGHGFFVCEDALRNTFPELTSAYLSFMNEESNLSLLPLFYEESFAFLLRHHQQLENLNLHYTNAADEREFPEILFQTDYPFSSAEKFQTLINGISGIQLTKLDLSVTFFEGKGRHILVIQLLSSQTRLKELRIKNIDRQNIGVWQVIPALLQRCYRTLTKVNISGCFCPALEEEPFLCSWIRNCSKLQKLKLQICGLQIIQIEDLPKQIVKLHLGNRVTQNQIDFISESFVMLEELEIPQGHWLSDSQVPRITVEVFKKLAKLEKLQKLTIMKKTASWKQIRKIISKTRGMEVVKAENQRSGMSCVKFDRKILDCVSF